MRGSRELLLLAMLVSTAQPGDAANRPAITFSGTVTDPSGKPAAGASVALNLWAPSTTSRDWRRAPDRHHVTADAHGGFRLDVPFAGEDWEATVLAMKAGHGAAGEKLYSPGNPTELRLALTRPGSVAGTVIDRAGQAVQGAVVSVLWAMRPDWSDTIQFSGAGPSAVTDTLGRYRLDSLPAGATVVLTVEHPRYALSRGGSEPIAVGSEDTVLALAPPGTVTGRVLLPNGSPAAQVPVSCQGLGLPLKTRTGAGGEYRFDRLPAGNYVIRAEPSAAKPDLTSDLQGVVIADGAEARCPDLHLGPGGIVTGRVSDKNGMPLAGVGVVSELDLAIAGIWMSAEGPTTQTDRDGRFRLRLPPSGPPPRALPGPPPGWHVKSNLYPDGAFGEEEDRVVQPGIRMDEGATVHLDLTLPRPTTLRAQVLDARGRPAAGATAQVSKGWRLETVQADSAGRFEVTRLVPSRPAKLLVFSRDRREGARQEVVPGQVKGEHVIRLEELPAVTGVVRDTSGAPVAGAVVGAERTFKAGFSSVSESTNRTVADAQGLFSLTLFPDAPYRVTAWAQGFALADPLPVEVGPAGRDASGARRLEFVLEPADGVLAGNLFDQNGRPVAGANVEIERSDSVHGRYRVGRATTDTEGRFRVSRLPRGELEIGASGQRSFSDRRKVSSGSTDLRFVLTPWEDPASDPGPSRTHVVAAATQVVPRADGGSELLLRYTLDPVGPPISTRGHRMLLIDKPPAGLKLPPFVSEKPLFLTARLGEGPGSLFTFALDETVGGGGYDRLYVDGAHSGDLTAGPPVLLSRWRDKKGFKPIRLAVPLGGSHVDYDAAILVDGRGAPGYRLHPWGYYSGEGRLGEESYPVALVDDNANGRYDDLFRSDENEETGDLLLIDMNRDGRFDQWEFAGPELRPCARWLQLDGRWYDLTIRPDGTRLTLTPTTAPLAVLSSDHRRFRLLLASQNGVLLVSGSGGQAQVPAGEYRVAGWEVEQRDQDGSAWVAQGDYRGKGVSMPALTARADTPLPELGTPLVAGLEVTQTSEREYQYMLRFTAASGEPIELVSRNGQRMPEPHLKITDARGREIANLPFEYG